MNKFTQAVQAAHAYAATLGAAKGIQIVRAAVEDVSTEEVLAAHTACQYVIAVGDTSLKMLRQIQILKDEGNLNFATWWPLYKNVNMYECFNGMQNEPAVAEFIYLLEYGSELEKQQYYWSEVMPALKLIPDITMALETSKTVMVEMRGILATKRRTF